MTNYVRRYIIHDSAPFRYAIISRYGDGLKICPSSLYV